MGKLSDISKSLGSLLSGYRSQQELNDNFDNIGDVFEDRVLWRDNPAGNANQMENELDMNSNKIINLGAPVDSNDAARLIDITSQMVLSSGDASVGTLTGEAGNPVVVNGTEDGFVAGDLFDSCQVVASTTELKALTGYADGSAVLLTTSSTPAKLYVMTYNATAASGDADTLTEFAPDDKATVSNGRQRWVQHPLVANPPPNTNTDPSTNVINLAAYGVTDGDYLWNGDNTDATMPLVQAIADINAYSINTIVIPPGTYKINNGGSNDILNFPNDATVYIQGAGVDVTTIEVEDGHAQNLGVAIRLKSTNGGGISALTIKGTSLRASSSNNNDVAIYVQQNTATDNSVAMRFANLKLDTEAGTGIRIEDPIGCIFENIQFSNVDGIGLYLETTGSATIPPRNNRIINCYATTTNALGSGITGYVLNNDTDGLVVEGMYFNDLAGSVGAGSWTTGSLIFSDANNCHFKNVEIEFKNKQTPNGIQIGSSSAGTVLDTGRVINVDQASGAVNIDSSNIRMIGDWEINAGAGSTGNCVDASAAGITDVRIDIDNARLTTASGNKIGRVSGSDYDDIGATDQTDRPLFVEGLYETGTTASTLSAGTNTVAHSTGAIPPLYTMALVCTTGAGSGGYAVGDEIPVGTGTGVATSSGLTAYVDTSNFGCSINGSVYVIPKAGGTRVALTLSEWKFKYYSWSFATSN